MGPSWNGARNVFKMLKVLRLNILNLNWSFATKSWSDGRRRNDVLWADCSILKRSLIAKLSIRETSPESIVYLIKCWKHSKLYLYIWKKIYDYLPYRLQLLGTSRLKRTEYLLFCELSIFQSISSIHIHAAVSLLSLHRPASCKNLVYSEFI